MDLEIRVEALEAEVKVLKSEIQSILLEIQEQILQHYYPALRVEDSEPSDTMLRAIDAIREKRKELSAPQPEVAEHTVTSARLPPVGPRREDPAAGQPQIARSRSHFTPPLLLPIPEAPNGSKVSPLSGAPTGTSDSQGADEWQAFEQMMVWIQDNITEMGEERIHSIIELYCQGGFLSSRVAKALVQAATLLV